MAKEKHRKTMWKVLDVLFDSLSFISIQYILLCCMHAFREKIVYVFFFALNTSIIVKYWSGLKRLIPNKILFVVIFALNYLILGIFTFAFGFLEISPVLRTC